MSDVTTLVDRATSSLLLDIDWDTTLQIVDLIRQGDITPKAAIGALTTKLNDSNPNVVLLALQVLESVVKNCGPAVHEQVACRDFMEEMMELLKRSSNEEVQKKVLLLLATWVYAFRSEPKYRAIQDTVNIMKAEGNHIPTVTESDAMFTADSAPVWADGGCCHRCRSQFTMLRRKHHCRACGQVFCSDCSSKTSTIPKFGIERDVRVCEHCYEEINNPQHAGAKTKAESTSANGPTVQKISPHKTDESGVNKPSTDEMREEEELQLALALSKSEAENKEKEKLKATSNLLGGGWRYPQSTSPTPSSPKTSASQVAEHEEMDPELAKYLNRSFWEQKQTQKQPQKFKDSALETDVPPHGRSFSPTLPSAPANTVKILSPIKTTEFLQNGDVEEVDDFVSTLRSQLEIFVNRMQSNQSRGRPIANDTAVQSLFMNITAMHAQLLIYIQDQDHKRVHCEQLQDKISQIRDARAALDALREEHREKVRREKEEQERIRQIQMMQKLEIMRKKKQEYLEYQRQLALHRMAESERQILSGQQQPVPQNLGGAQPVYGPLSYPPQGYPTQAPQMGGYMFQHPQGENPPPGMMPPYQGPPTVSGQPPMPGGYPGPVPLPHQPPSANLPPPQPPSANPEYGHYSVQGLPNNVTVPMQNLQPYGPPQHGLPVTSPPLDPAAGHPPLPQQEEQQTELISFD